MSIAAAQGGAVMAEPRRSQRKGRGRRREGRARRSAAEGPLEAARRRADRKARVARDGLQFALVVGLLAIFLRPLAWVVGLLWGIRLARDAIRHFVEPALRRRWIEREVHRELARSVHHERQSLETRHSRQMEALAAGVAHEIRNPVSAARSLVQQMGEDPAAPENVEYAQVALEELGRVERSISHLLRFAREEDLALQPLRMDEVVRSALGSLEERIRRQGVRVTTSFDDPGEMQGDPEKLRRVVINLVGNALDALQGTTSHPPRLEVATDRNLAGSQVWLRVRDNGPGIDAERRAQIWSPFYTSKRGGTGLGLALCRKLVDGHGGAIEAREAPGGGAEILVTLPRDPAPREDR